MKSNKRGIKRVWSALKYSLAGFKAAFKTEEAFRMELYMSAILLPVTFFLNVTKVEKVLLIGSVLIVLLMELVNTAIETVIDRISEDYHIASKKAKDIGSLLVLVSIVYLVITWGLIILWR